MVMLSTQTVDMHTQNEHRILVVEDDPDVACLLEYRLLCQGYHVQRVLNGGEVTSAVRSERPDVILLDLMLPGIDGFAVLRLLKAAPQTTDIPVIVVTASSEPQHHERALRLGAAQVLVKRGFLKAIDHSIRSALAMATAPAVQPSAI